jgi:hypothetical protein
VNFFDRVLDRIEGLTNVASVSAVNYPPTGVLGTAVEFTIDGQPPKGPGEALLTRYWVIDPAYFRTLRIPLLAGRAFTPTDADNERGSVIINETMARRYWPGPGRGQTALGHRLQLHFPRSDAFWLPHASVRPLTVVGVVGNIREDTPGAPALQVYLPYRQNPSAMMHLVVRPQRGDPRHLARAIKAKSRRSTLTSPCQRLSRSSRLHPRSFRNFT